MVVRRKVSFVRAAVFAVAQLCFIGPFGTLAVFGQDQVPIQFEPGATSATINGTVQGQEYIDYIVSARGGQTMVVSLAVTGTNGTGSAFFNILPAGQDYGGPYIGSTDDDRRAEITVPSTGEWAIRVYLMGNDRDAGKTVGYSIDVYIAPGGGGSNSSAVAPPAGLLPEEDFFIVSLTEPGDTLNVRDAPRPSGRLLDRLENGAAVRNAGGCTMSDGRQWCKVQRPQGGVEGWVAARYLRLPGPGGGGENTATADDSGGALAGSGAGPVYVQFAPGTSGAELTDQLLPGESRRYVLGATDGQEFYFRLAANGPDMFYQIFNPDGSFLLDQMTADREYRGQLWQSGDHVIEVINRANGAQSYNVIFGIQ